MWLTMDWHSACRFHSIRDIAQEKRNDFVAMTWLDVNQWIPYPGAVGCRFRSEYVYEIFSALISFFIATHQ